MINFGAIAGGVFMYASGCAIMATIPGFGAVPALAVLQLLWQLCY
jgi:hypothetical protein